MKTLNFKRFKAIIVLATALLLLLSASAFATENIGVSPKQPSITANTNTISPQSISKPINLWNLATMGKYDFAGTSAGSATLYTNYKFIGSDTYHLCCNNYSDNTLTVKVQKATTLGTTYSTKTIAANSSATWDVFGNGMTSTTEIWVRFTGVDMDFGRIY
jgi:hypothetical protein